MFIGYLHTPTIICCTQVFMLGIYYVLILSVIEVLVTLSSNSQSGTAQVILIKDNHFMMGKLKADF